MENRTGGRAEADAGKHCGAPLADREVSVVDNCHVPATDGRFRKQINWNYLQNPGRSTLEYFELPAVGHCSFDGRSFQCETHAAQIRQAGSALQGWSRHGEAASGGDGCRGFSGRDQFRPLSFESVFAS